MRSESVDRPPVPGIAGYCCIAYLVWTGGVVAAFGRDIGNWHIRVLLHAAIVAAIVALGAMRSMRRTSAALTCLQALYPLGVIAYAWNELDAIVPLIFKGYWATAGLVRLDHALFGVHPTVWAQRFYGGPLDGLMNLFYSGYYGFSPVICLVFLLRRRLDDLMTIISLVTFTYLANDLLYGLLPALGPRMVHELAGPMARDYCGGIFGEITRLAQSTGGVRGACFPSSHVAGAIAWCLAVRRHDRKLAGVLMVITTGVPVSAVYLGYHHAVDVFAGIAAGFGSHHLALALLRRRRVAIHTPLCDPRTIAGLSKEAVMNADHRPCLRARGVITLLIAALPLTAAESQTLHAGPTCPTAGHVGEAASIMSSGYSPAPFRSGETLRYRARWKFIRLGTLVVEQRRAEGDGEEDPDLFEVRMAVDSWPGLRFVSTHITSRAILSSRDPQNRSFIFESHNADSTKMLYESTNPAQPLLIRIWRGARQIFEGGVPRHGAVYDADGLFMAARGLSKTGMYLTIPTIVDREVHPTRIRFTNEVRKVRVPALPHGILARRIEADADWATGSCAGLTGRFWGWVTDDDAAIPLVIGVEIALGSVVLELDSYARPDESGQARTKSEVEGWSAAGALRFAVAAGP